MKKIKFIIFFVITLTIISVVKVEAQNIQALDRGKGTEFAGFERFKIFDGNIQEGFQFQIRFRLNSSDFNKKVMIARLRSDGKEFYTVFFQKGRVLIKRPVNYHGTIKWIEYNSWKPVFVDKSLYNGQIMTLRLAMTRYSTKYFVYGASFKKALCQWEYMGTTLASIKSAFKGSVSKGKFEVDIISKKGNKNYGLVRMLYDPTHKLNNGSCWKPNQPLRERGDPLTGLNNNNKESCNPKDDFVIKQNGK